MPAVSDTGIHSALISLLPPATLPSGIPSKLTSHATTLLNLSRQRATNLKPEEEIARAHACAEIACRKLRVQLRLPNVKAGAGAPAKPAVYKKLVAFLEGRLDDVGIGTPKSARKRNAEEDLDHGRTPGTGSTKRAKKSMDIPGPEDTDMVDAQATPTKKRGKVVIAPKVVDEAKNNADSPRTPKKGNKGAVARSVTNNGEAPNYVMPSIRKLCHSFGTTSLAPHVYTGVCIVLKLAGLWPPGQHDQIDTMLETDTKSLTIALYIMVLTRMQKGKMTTPVYILICSKSIANLELANNTDIQSRIEAWIAKINQNKWAVGQDWWDSVPEGVIAFTGQPIGTSDAQRGEEDLAEDEQTDSLAGNRSSRSRIAGSQRADMMKKLAETDPEGVLLPGLGTMMQHAVDWLSEDRQTDFEEWKEDILRRMQEADRTGGRRGKAVAV